MSGKRKFVVTLIILLITCLPESGCINTGISREEDAQLSPSPPAQVSVEIQDGNISLKWLGTGDDRIQYYQIYRKSPNEDWQRIMKIEAESDNIGMYDFMDENVEADITYVYGVSAINIYGRESTISESPLIVVP